MVCSEPITYRGNEAVQRDLDNFNAALATVETEEAFIPAVAPGTIALQRQNEYYPTQEEYRAAIADAGFILQIDGPRVVTQYGMPDPDPTIEEYRDFASLRVEASNHALAGLPQDQVRYHLCWGSGHGPHVTDVPLRDIVNIILRVNVGAYCVEAANPRHAHEWEVRETTKLPDGKILVPGMVRAHHQHCRAPGVGGPADRKLRPYAGPGERHRRHGLRVLTGHVQPPRVHPSIVWAKLEALAEGAALASRQLWS